VSVSGACACRLHRVEHAIALAIAYLVGSVDFGVIVPKVMGIDIYAAGSGNPGTSNVFRTLGKKAAATVLAGDLLKGVAAVWVGVVIVDTPFAYWSAVAAVVGHSFPIWHDFKGGKGVATALGGALFLQPLVGGVAALIWISIVLKTKTASVASLIGVGLLLPGFALRGVRGVELVAVGVLVAIVYVRHAPNIKRMLAGGENTLESR
jgi:acyl phosphate:glycerol-3-phosphate acyltransferase